jgi:hypothetical protein
MMVASTAGTGTIARGVTMTLFPTQPWAVLGVSLVRIIALPHTLVAATRLDGRNCKAHQGDL